jgi:hypothetical protein
MACFWNVYSGDKGTVGMDVENACHVMMATGRYARCNAKQPTLS